MRKRERLLLLCGLLLWLLAACTAANSEQQETVQALEQLIITTATARAEEEISPADELATAEAEATEAAQTLEAEITEAAVTSTAASSAATATRESLISTAGAATAMVITVPPSGPDSPIETPLPPVPTVDQAVQEAVAGELATYGVDPANGQLAWMHPPVVLDVEGFQQFILTNTVSLESEGDFVLAADITWTTEFGAAGCGFVLRSTSFEIDSSQYLAFMTRLDGGFAMFQTRFNGEFRDSELVDFPISGVDPAFQWPNESTNRLAVVAQGDNFTIYINGTRIGTAVPQTKLSQGLVAFIALNDSGRTICEFENGWLWRMN